MVSRDQDATSGSPRTRVELRNLFLTLQRQLSARLEGGREVITHPGTKGTAAELNWIAMLSDYLPERYEVDSAFVVDADGSLSEQLDVVIFDRQYSPFLFNQDEALYVPAESVYAVLEVKQAMGRDEIIYAGDKIRSVRRLRWTSRSIPHAGGRFEPKAPFVPLGGLLCLESGWNPPFGAPFQDAVGALRPDQRLDLGCVLTHGAFETASANGRLTTTVSEPELALVVFFIRLVERLQDLGTVPAIDWTEYARSLR
jgi:hypothetical protein